MTPAPDPSSPRPAVDGVAPLPSPASDRRLVLLRHGRTAFNAVRRFQGQLDPPLDDLGRAQAVAVAAVLAGLPPSVVVSSDLQRASSTADALGALVSLPVRRDPGLREIALGSWQGLTHDEARDAFPQEWHEWRQGLDVRRGGGETYAEVADRATAAVDRALVGMPPGGAAVVVTHGGTARAVTARLMGLPADLWWRLAPLGNCAWGVLVETERGWRLAGHGLSVRQYGSPDGATADGAAGPGKAGREPSVPAARPGQVQ